MDIHVFGICHTGVYLEHCNNDAIRINLHGKLIGKARIHYTQ